MIGQLAAAALLFTSGDYSPGLERVTPTSQDATAAAFAESIIEHPDSVQPMQYILVVQHLWGQGDRAQAAFWYYLWQIRTRPWARADTAATGPLRGSLTELWGRPVNEWIGSDPEARTELLRRAVSFEATLPLSSERPSHMATERWDALVTSERQAYAAEFERFAIMPEYHGAEAQAARRGNGLYVGPWQEPGTPLPDHWR